MNRQVVARSVNNLLDLLEKLSIKAAGADYMDHKAAFDEGYIDPFIERMNRV
jgi:hypothetical protein